MCSTKGTRGRVSIHALSLIDTLDRHPDRYSVEAWPSVDRLMNRSTLVDSRPTVDRDVDRDIDGVSIEDRSREPRASMDRSSIDLPWNVKFRL